jgi:putative transposase
MLRKDPFITGEYYHIYNRGIDKRNIFKSKYDYERFILLLFVANSDSQLRLDNLINHSHKTFKEILELDKGQSLVSIGAWCLMTNHFHLLVRQKVDGGITKFMKKLGTGYSMYFNIKYQRQGALFGGPFKSRLIGNNDNYLMQLLAYIHINPLEIKFSDIENKIGKYDKNQMKKFLESYRYSSYKDYLGYGREENNILDRGSFPEYFNSKKSFKEFVENLYLFTKTPDSKDSPCYR